jgi:hypothetical protein
MFNWYRDMSRYAKWAGWLTAFFSLIVAGYSAAAILEPGFPAHRGYVRYVDAQTATDLLAKEQKREAVLAAENDKLRARVVLAQLDVNKERRERLLHGIKDRELEMKSPEAAATPGYQALIKERVDRAKEEINKLDANDKSLFDEQAKSQKHK